MIITGDSTPERDDHLVAADSSDADSSTDGVPMAEYAFPGPLRDRLVAAILDGSKTTTTTLLVEYAAVQEVLPKVGDQEVVIDSWGQPLAVTEVTGVQLRRLSLVSAAHALGEGEGFSSVAEWRRAHEDFWHSEEFRDGIGGAEFKTNDDTVCVCVTFHVLRLLEPSSQDS